MDAESFGRALLLLGAVVAALGIPFVLGARIPLLGRLPGDLAFRWGGGSFFFPIVSSLLVSVVLTVVLNLVLRLLNRS